MATIVLTANVGSTVLSDGRLSASSRVAFDPKTANAAAEIRAGTMYVALADRGAGSWTITHAENPQVDREFEYAVF